MITPKNKNELYKIMMDNVNNSIYFEIYIIKESS